jgi:hypothetical protein
MSPRPLPDYYAVLQVAPTAEPAVIDAAYRQLARLYHPDVSATPDAIARMQAINAAFAVLRDAEQRARYDKLRGRRAARAARLQRLHREGDWYAFRIGGADDAFLTIAILESEVPAYARRWDDEMQQWHVHADYADTLAQLFTDFGTSGAHVGAPVANSMFGRPLLPPWHELLALAICLGAVVILAFAAQTDAGGALRGRAMPLLDTLLAQVDPSLALKLAVEFPAALAALLLVYIVWNIRRPSRPGR